MIMPYKGCRGPIFTPFSYADVLPAKEELPPAVVAARRALGWTEEEIWNGKENIEPECDNTGRAPVTPVEPCLEPMRLVTEAGEVLTKRRRMGPWVPGEERGKPNRGSSQLALQIASNPAKKDLAVKQFGSLTLALTTQNTKESLFALWEKICRRLGLEALPVTDQSMVEVAAVLRASGYKAVTAYVQEAKIRHIRAGYVWDNKLNMLFGDVKRAAKRAQGPAVRAEDVRLEWWAMLMNRVGENPDVESQQSCWRYAGVDPSHKVRAA